MRVAIAPPYDHIVKRGLHVNFRVLEAEDGASEDGKDISTSNWVTRIRAYEGDDATTFAVNQILAKSTPATGYLKDYVPAVGTVYAMLTWEIVLTDTGTADATTPSGYAERVLAIWKAPMQDAPP